MFGSTTLEVVDALVTTNAPSNNLILHFPEAASAHLFPGESSTSIPHGSDAHSSPKPSVRLLFSLLPRHDLYLVVLPAFILSMVAGVVAPLTTLVISNVFNVFTEFCRITSPSSSDRENFKQDIATSALELLFLAAGSLALGSLTSFLWILAGERNSFILQQNIYASVSRREMAWFDAKVTEGNPDSSTGAGGLTAGFVRCVVFSAHGCLSDSRSSSVTVRTFAWRVLLQAAALFSISPLASLASFLDFSYHGP
jgi:ATP-binding cassette subfamily B (MDR/TAP) protein 1